MVYQEKIRRLTPRLSSLLGGYCNKTNPTYTFFLTIIIISSLYRSFCIPYCFPLLSHDMSSCQYRSYPCDINSITLYFYSHSMSHSLLLFSFHDQLLASLFITHYFYSHSTTYSYLTFPLHDLLSTSLFITLSLHDTLFTSHFS